MSPVAVTKTDDVAEHLWRIFAANEALLPLDTRRYENEAKHIAKVDPVGAAFIKVLLAGIAGDDKKVLKGIDGIVAMDASLEDFLNSIQVLECLGKMRDAYRIAQLGLDRHSLSQHLNEYVIRLAVTHEDIVGLKKALEHWNKLFPDSLPFVGMDALANDVVSSAIDDETVVTDFLSRQITTNDLIKGSPLPKRMEDMLDKLLAKVDP